MPAFAWGLTGRSDYFSYTWHSLWDTFDVAIPEYQRHSATVVALAALGAANLPHLLSRDGVGRSRPRPDAQPAVEGRLGIQLKGLTIVGVDKDGVAAAAGLKTGDKILSVGKSVVRSAVEFNAALRDSSPPWVFVLSRDGQEVGLMVGRAGKKKAGAPVMR